MNKTLAKAPNRSEKTKKTEKTEKKLLKLKRYRSDKKELERFMKSYGRLRNLESTASNTGEVRKEIETEKLRLCKKTKLLIEHTREIDCAIEAVPDGTQALVLRYRYIDGLRWEAISEELCYSLRMVHYLHKKAVEALAI